MATSKTLTPTNVTIQIPAFADKPDQRANSDCIDKVADAINALSDQILPNTAYTGDLNNAPDGIIYTGSGVSNTPAAYDYWYVFTMLYNGNNTIGSQIAIARTASNPPMYYRAKSGGTWTDWKELATTDKIPVFVSATATIGNISANAYAEATVDVSIPAGTTGVKSIIPRYTSAGLPIAGAYPSSGAPSGKSRITVGVYNPKSSAVSNVTATIDVVFLY